MVPGVLTMPSPRVVTLRPELAPSIVLTAAVIAFFAVLTRPQVAAGPLPGGVVPDSYDYAYGAQSLLGGRYVVDWDGGAPRVPRYPPGFSVLLVPAVALGGVNAAVWVPYLMALLLGALGAILATTLSGLVAAPLAAILLLLTPATADLARLVMSDLPAATLAVVELLLLCTGGRRRVVAAGAIAGALVWVRLASAPLIVAGVVGLTAYRQWRRLALWYTLGALPALVALAAWQTTTFGSPVTTSYQAAGASSNGRAEIQSFIAPQYLLGEPTSRDGEALSGAATRWRLPNLAVYPLELAGADAFLSLPGVGLLGFIALSRYARRAGAPGVFGRFGVSCVAVTLGTYLPYFWQSARFFTIPAALLAIAAAALFGELIGAVARMLRRRSAR